MACTQRQLEGGRCAGGAPRGQLSDNANQLRSTPWDSTGVLLSGVKHARRARLAWQLLQDKPLAPCRAQLGSPDCTACMALSRL